MDITNIPRVKVHLKLDSVYVLALKGGNYYVGYTNDISNRLYLHCHGKGSKWTKLHAVVRVVSIRSGTLADEELVTIAYIKKYGVAKVRGARWVSTVAGGYPPESYLPT